MTERELDRLLAEIDQENPDIQALMTDSYVSRILQLVRTVEAYRVDEAAIDAELDAMAQDVALDAWDIDDGVDAIQACVDARFRVNRVRDRYIALYKALSKMAGKYERILRSCTLRLQTSDAAASMTLKAFDAVVKVALDPLLTTQASIERLLKVLGQGLTHLDQKSRMIDAWYTIYQQYRYQNGKTRPHGAAPEEDRYQEDRPQQKSQARRLVR